MTGRVRRPARRRGPGWKEYLLALSATVITGLGVGVAVGESYPLDGKDPTAIEGGALPAANGPLGFLPVPRLQEPMNLLVMASDVNYTVKNGKRVMGLTGNTDTMILVRLDPPTGSVRALSIPRDTRVPIPGHGTFKINAANPFGGPQLAAEVVANTFNVQVDRYLTINPKAVIQLVDALGGVDVFVPKAMRYDDWSGKLHIRLQKGENHLDGQRAHDFLRFRHDELGDIGRVQRQQAFVQAALRQYLQPGNLLKTPQLLNIARENLETNLSADEILRITGWAKDLTRDRVALTMVPGGAQTIGGGSYWVHDELATRRIVEGFFMGQVPAEARTPASYRIALRDASGERRAVRAARETLNQAGYRQVEFDGENPEQGIPETQIIAQTADVAGAEAVAAALGVGKVVVAATGSLYADFTVVVGRDWARRQAASAPAAGSPP